MKSLKNLFNVLVILLAIVSLSVFVVVNLSIFLYPVAVYYFHLTTVSGHSSASLTKCYFFIVRYLEVPWDYRLHLVIFKASAKGLHHFQDVRHLMMFNNVFMILFNYLGFRIIKELKRNHLLWRLINPFKLLCTAILVLMSLILVDFQQFFINFHRIMFRNQDWVFNSMTDPVIKVLPMPFFAWCFLGFFLMILCLLGWLIRYALNTLNVRN